MKPKILPKFKPKTKNYAEKIQIEGVEIVKQNVFRDDRGSFCELIRVKENGEGCILGTDMKEHVFKGFKLKQTSSSLMRPGLIKAWHYHLKQTDIWTVAPGDGVVLVGLFDAREDSNTSGKTQRVVLGEGSHQYVRIPPGVAHGCMNIGSKDAVLTYFVDRVFDIKDPDEHRIDIDEIDFQWGIING